MTLVDAGGARVKELVAAEELADGLSLDLGLALCQEDQSDLQWHETVAPA